MDTPNFGSRGAWVLVAILIMIGLISAIVWIIQGIIWVFNHVKIV